MQTKYLFKNIIEDEVITEVAEKIKLIPDVCKCEKCFCDICAIVLNNIPPQYTTSEQGDLIGKANSLMNFEMRSRIAIEIFKAIELVSNNPRHV